MRITKLVMLPFAGIAIAISLILLSNGYDLIVCGSHPSFKLESVAIVPQAECLQLDTTGIFNTPTLVIRNYCNSTLSLDLTRSHYTITNFTTEAGVMRVSTEQVTSSSRFPEVAFCTYKVSKIYQHACMTDEVLGNYSCNPASLALCSNVILFPNTTTFLQGLVGNWSLAGPEIVLKGNIRALNCLLRIPIV